VGFRVVDQGCGIPRELLPRVTEPFFTTKREKGGTGLGLALCRRIVDEHRGEMHIDSAPGAGTSVTVLFPPRSTA
jgi:two-component system, NtrC family, sensor kinase